MRFGSTAKVLLKCKLKYYRISEWFGMACVQRWALQMRAHPARSLCERLPRADRSQLETQAGLVDGCLARPAGLGLQTASGSCEIWKYCQSTSSV